MSELNIIFEDEDLIIADKPSGLTVNVSQTNKGETLQDQVSAYLKLPEGDLGIGERAGIVHRLDKDTSGLMIVAKREKTFANLQEQFRERTVTKEYLALVHGRIKEDEGFVDAPILRVGSFGKFGISQRGRESKTEYSVLSRYIISNEVFEKLSSDETKNRQRYLKTAATFYTLLNVFPKTGRTHQIRVHLKSISAPVVSDAIYCPSKLIKFDLGWCSRLFLHARAITFVHPKTKKLMFFESSLPSELNLALLNLKEE